MTPRKRVRTGAALPGPPSPVATAPGQHGQDVEIVYGHNAEVRKVLMMFNVAAERLVLDPDAADHVAQQLMIQAKLARGRVQ